MRYYNKVALIFVSDGHALLFEMWALWKPTSLVTPVTQYCHTQCFRVHVFHSSTEVNNPAVHDHNSSTSWIRDCLKIKFWLWKESCFCCWNFTWTHYVQGESTKLGIPVNLLINWTQYHFWQVDGGYASTHSSSVWIILLHQCTCVSASVLD